MHSDDTRVRRSVPYRRQFDPPNGAPRQRLRKRWRTPNPEPPAHLDWWQEVARRDSGQAG
jgi:hypothetical protein